MIYLYAPYSAGMNVFFDWCLLTVAPMSIGMGLFNLIPIPPLDGSKVLAVFLPNSAYGQLMRYERYGILVSAGAELAGPWRKFFLETRSTACTKRCFISFLLEVS
ncbi:MAG: site-2 protease family protein [Dysosmobacter sp.]